MDLRLLDRNVGLLTRFLFDLHGQAATRGNVQNLRLLVYRFRVQPRLLQEDWNTIQEVPGLGCKW